MHVTTIGQMTSLQSNIEASLADLNKTQQEIATGKKLNVASDDPSGSSRLLAYNASLTDNTQFQSDTNSAKTILSATDSSLNDLSTAIIAARQIASQGANSTQTTGSQSALIAQVDQLITGIINTANQNIGGKYIFSGTMTHTPPYVDNPAAHSAPAIYQGNAGSVTATIGTGNVMQLNTPGSAVFDPVLQSLNTLKADLTANNITAISNDITSLDANLSTVSSARSIVGAKLNEVSSVQQNLARAKGEYQSAISNIQDVDLAQAYVQLQSDTNVYQASLAATARAFQYNLTDFLK
jgi:flagellar hook-associated protein 3 FlgL